MSQMIMPTLQPRRAEKLRLRWHFQYSNGRKARVGVWNGAASNDADPTSCWKQPKDNLARLLIESEDVMTGETKVVFDIPGQAYAFMQWLITARSPSITGKGFKMMRLVEVVVGLKVWTNDNIYTVYIDGSIARRSLMEDEKKFQFREHQAGC